MDITGKREADRKVLETLPSSWLLSQAIWFKYNSCTKEHKKTILTKGNMACNEKHSAEIHAQQAVTVLQTCLLMHFITGMQCAIHLLLTQER
jgi:hypothetical protein